MKNPFISVIINNYNYEKFLSKAIDSVLDQTYSRYEVIVVDDGSTDQSHLIIKLYKDYVKAVIKENGGQASALNEGFRVSTGEIIIFLDSDDYLFPNAIEQVVAAWKLNISKVQYRLQVINSEGESIGVHPPVERNMKSGDVIPDILRTGNYATSLTSGNAFCRNVLDKIMPIPEEKFRLAADGYLVFSVPFYGEIVSIEEPLGAYRIHGNNLWAQNGNVDVYKLHKFIRHDLERYKVIAEYAEKLGHQVSERILLQDYLHVRSRIKSFKIDSKSHPIKSDSSFDLMFQGLLATVKSRNLKCSRKLFLILWFIGIWTIPTTLINKTRYLKHIFLKAS
jgi:glycosyltransferase involved in cell wall biosynthesis